MKITLRHIAYEVTPECNLSCCFCYNHWKCPESAPPKAASYQQSIATLKRLFGQAEISHISFTGGEPLTGERFLELVLFCRLKHKKVSVISNGNGGSLEDYETLLSLGVSTFELPFLSANETIHDQMTGKKGSWKNSLDCMLKLKQEKGKVIPVIVLTKQNIHTLEETLRYLKNAGFSQIMLNR